MTAGLLQLIARGEQDEYLTGNPQVTFYKYTFRRHTNFAMEMHELQFNDIINWNQMNTCVLSRKGDLLTNMYLKIHLPALTKFTGNEYARWVNYIGLAMIKKIEIEIGGQVIDSQSGEWIYLYNQLSLRSGKRNGFDYMVGFDIDPNQEKVMYIPLCFWFNTHNGLAIPLVALQYHEVKLRVIFRDFKECTINAFNIIPITNVTVIANYVYLDVIERKAFAKEEQEYLIEQVQKDDHNSIITNNGSVDLNFCNPVKELVWLLQRTDYTTVEFREWFNYTYADNKSPIKELTLQFNGLDRFSPMDGEYFNLVQPFQHHTCIPDNAGINSYSFAIHPENPQPSGSFNFSKADSARFKYLLHDDYLKDENGNTYEAFFRVYALTMNVMVIKAGMAHVKFSK